MPGRYALAASFCTALCTAGGVDAGTRFAIQADAGVTASSNPLLLQGADLEALLAEASVEPSVTFTDSTGSTLEVRGEASARRYDRRYGDYLLGGGQATGTVRASERLSLSATGSYDREISADVLTDSLATTVDPRSVRNRVVGRASLTWRPNSRSELRPAVAYETTSYEDSPLLMDTKLWTADLAYSRRLSSRSSIGLRATGTRNRTASQPDIDTLALLATFDQRVGPFWRLYAEAGAERVSAFRSAGGTSRAAQWLFSGQARFCGRGERLDGCIEGGVATDASGLGGIERRTFANANLSRRLSERFSLDLLADYQRSSPKGDIVLPDLESLRAQAGLEWRPSPVTAFTLQGGYQRRVIGFGQTADGKFLGLQFRWRPRLS